MPPISFIAGIFATIAAAAALPVPQPGEIRTFKDWAAGCDNSANCEAVSFVPDQGGAGYDGWGGPIKIVRTAGSEDIFKIRFLFEADSMDRYTMLIDGKLVDTGPIVQGDYAIEIVGEDAKKVANAIISGNQLVLRGPEGENITQISLAGSSAALRYIDQKQDRAGTITALVAKGKKMFKPSPSTVPVITVDQWEAAKLAPDTSALVALAEDSKCKEDRYGLVEDQAYPLGKRGQTYRALVLISCGSGAYNFSSAPYIGEFREDSSEGWTFTPAKFDRQPSWGGEGGLPLLVNAGWDEKDQTLSSYGKGRGLGDCGNAENYVWDGEAFRLIDASAMDECRGAYDWITTWRAEYRKLEQASAAAK
ncbi:MAG: DUF1176 domain-containing protein [Parasphingorhabdus sp.]|uniref:DUF1176 domain-containing protein n=1 Tax=Parasphingorhabdus sp. TaxID=2709688 RepID=UPI0032648747